MCRKNKMVRYPKNKKNWKYCLCFVLKMTHNLHHFPGRESVSEIWCIQENSSHVWPNSFYCSSMVCFPSQLWVYSYKYTPDNGRCQSGCSVPRAVHSHWLWKTGFSVCLCLWASISQSLPVLVCVAEVQWHCSHSRASFQGGRWLVNRKDVAALMVLCCVFFEWEVPPAGMPKQLCVGLVACCRFLCV